MVDQLHPLEVNPETNEPFLRLLPPFERIIITPPRAEDADRLINITTDPEVVRWMGGFNVSENGWLSRAIDESSARIVELRQISSENLQPVDFCPVRSIREVKSDGTDELIGDIGFKRCGYSDIGDEERRRGLVAENNGKSVGSHETVWQVGDFLAPSHHRQGIMTAVFRNLLERWAIPRMGVARMRVAVFQGNEGSVRMFEKNGFKVSGQLDEAMVVRGETKNVIVLEWELRGTA